MTVQVMRDDFFARTLSFKIRIGGGNGCEAADGGEDVVVEYQPLGSVVYNVMQKMAYNGNDMHIPACSQDCFFGDVSCFFANSIYHFQRRTCCRSCGREDFWHYSTVAATLQ